MAEIALLPAAAVDYEEAFSWYASRSLRAALRFESAVEDALLGIKNAPQQGPKLDERHRYHRLSRYPYHIVYRIENDGILIVAVAHGSRRPGYWKDR